MSEPTMLNVMRESVTLAECNNDHQHAYEAAEALSVVADLIAFVDKIATPYSEPLNSMCASRRLEDRRAWMGDLRRAAQELSARVRGERHV